MAKVKVVLIDGVRHLWDPNKEEATEIVKLSPEERELEMIAELDARESSNSEVPSVSEDKVAKKAAKKVTKKASKEEDDL